MARVTLVVLAAIWGYSLLQQYKHLLEVCRACLVALVVAIKLLSLLAAHQVSR